MAVRPKRELWEKLRPEARRMRHVPTPAEDALWSCLRRHGIDGTKFRRQHAIGRFIVDFYCPDARLVIEVDGDAHAGREEEDAIREEFLKQQGLRVVRFRNERVLCDLDCVVAEIGALCASALPADAASKEL